jgi:hypothetical protein
LPLGTARVRLCQAAGNGPALFILIRGGHEAATCEPNITQTNMRPVKRPIIPFWCAKADHPAIDGFPLRKVASLNLKVAMPIRTLDVVRVQPGRFGIGLTSLFRVCKAGDCTEIAVSSGGDLAVLSDAGGLVLGNRLEKGNRLRHLPRREQAEHLLQPLVAFACPLGNHSDRLVNPLLGTRLDRGRALLFGCCKNGISDLPGEYRFLVRCHAGVVDRDIAASVEGRTLVSCCRGLLCGKWTGAGQHDEYRYNPTRCRTQRRHL